MPTTTEKPRVLVADDERVIADTLAMILNQSGFEARAVYSGEKALELAEFFQPDMLISDVIMADLNGIDAAIRIRALLPSIKILLFSGQAATADLLEKARKDGYEFDILAKPVHPQDLSGPVAEVARIIRLIGSPFFCPDGSRRERNCPRCRALAATRSNLPFDGGPA